MSTEKEGSTKILTVEAQADRDSFIADYGLDGHCHCSTTHPPCTHPGNPLGQDDTEECWRRDPIVPSYNPKVFRTL